MGPRDHPEAQKGPENWVPYQLIPIGCTDSFAEIIMVAESRKDMKRVNLFCRMEKSPETQLWSVWTSRLKGAEWIWRLKKEIGVELNGFMYLVVTSRLNQNRLIGDWKF